MPFIYPFFFLFIPLFLYIHPCVPLYTYKYLFIYTYARTFYIHPKRARSTASRELNSTQSRMVAEVPNPYPLNPRTARCGLPKVASRPLSYRHSSFCGSGSESFRNKADCRFAFWEGYHESRRCSRDTYPESCIAKYTSMRRLNPVPETQVGPSKEKMKAEREQLVSLPSTFGNEWQLMAT